MTDLTSLLNNLRAQFSAKDVSFVVGGSFALAARGFIRGSEDIDLMVLTPRDGLLAVQRALQGERYTRLNEVTYRDEETGFLLDIIPVEDAAQREVFDRATKTSLHRASDVPVLTAEGVAIMLLREATIGDAAKRPRRLLDLQDLARVNALDYAYIQSWVKQMGYAAAYRDWDSPQKPALV